MCVAIIKPMGRDLPTDDILERCFQKNLDGAGIAYQNKNKTGFNIVKGLMTYQSFKDKLTEIVGSMGGEDKAKERLILLHFRIGTHGSKSDPKHTHPFPLSGKTDKLEALETSSAQVCMHNGILSGWGTSTYGVANKDAPKLSDTMDFIKNFVYPLEHGILAKEDTIWKNKLAQRFITREVSGSRFVIANGKGGFIYWGQWHDHQGCMYSNKDYEPYVPTVYSYSYDRSRSYYNAYTDSFERDSYEDAWGQGSTTPAWNPKPTTPPALPAAPASPAIPSLTSPISMRELMPGVERITMDMVYEIAEEFEFLRIGRKHGVRVFFKSKDGDKEYEFTPSSDHDVFIDACNMEVWAYSWTSHEFRFVKTAASYMLESKDSPNVWHRYAEV